MAAHYLPNLRKIITKKKKKVKPVPLDFHTERNRVPTITSGVAHATEPPNPPVPIGNPLRPQLISQCVAAAVPVSQRAATLDSHRFLVPCDLRGRRRGRGCQHLRGGTDRGLQHGSAKSLSATKPACNTPRYGFE
ncbi:hypothetical protein MTO96_038465 [Rhipicephalus appendiculatus]